MRSDSQRFLASQLASAAVHAAAAGLLIAAALTRAPHPPRAQPAASAAPARPERDNTAGLRGSDASGSQAAGIPGVRRMRVMVIPLPADASLAKAHLDPVAARPAQAAPQHPRVDRPVTAARAASAATPGRAAVLAIETAPKPAAEAGARPLAEEPGREAALDAPSPELLLASHTAAAPAPATSGEGVFGRPGASRPSTADPSLPEGAGLGALTGSASGGRGNALNYLAEQRIRYVARLVGAPAARRARRSSFARVQFEVDRHGYVAKVQVHRATGVPQLDREIDGILHLAEPFPAGQRTFEVELPFDETAF